jgi:hypothetical protein
MKREIKTMKTDNFQPMTVIKIPKSMTLKMEVKTYIKDNIHDEDDNDQQDIHDEDDDDQQDIHDEDEDDQQDSDREDLHSQDDQQGSVSYKLYDQQESDQEGSETHDKDLQERDRDSPAGAGNVSYISWMGAY